MPPQDFKLFTPKPLLTIACQGNTLGSNIILTDLLCSELSRLLPKFVNMENSEPESSTGQGVAATWAL